MDLSNLKMTDVVTTEQHMIDGFLLEIKENERYKWFEYGGTSIQSLMNKEQPEKVMMPVAQALLLFILFKKTPIRLLNLGLGGASLERLLMALPNTFVTTVEHSQTIINMAKQHFNLPEQVDVVCEDALQFIQRSEGGYNVVLFDLFIGEKNPEFLFDANFYQQLNTITCPNSIIAINIKADSNEHLIRTLLAIKYYFRHIALIEFSDYSNIVILASTDPIPDKESLQQAFIDFTESNLSCSRWVDLQAAIDKISYIPPGIATD